MPLYPDKPLTPQQAAQVPILTLAYLGDSLYDLYIRSHLVHDHDDSTGRLNTRAIGYVSAVGQSKAAKTLWDRLEEEEQQILRRGRNAKASTAAKNAPIQDYRMATGFEALLGYLYLTGQDTRARQIMTWAYDVIGKEDTDCPK